MLARIALASTGLSCALALAPAGAAQSVCYSENAGPNYEDASSTSTALFGIKFTPSSSITVNQAQLWTGEVAGSMSVGIWSHDSINDQPLAQLGGGPFIVSLPVGWQGGDLIPSVALTAGTTYWLAWGTISGAQSSIDLPQATNGQPFRVSLDGGLSWGPLLQSQERHFKFRLICGCSGPAVEYGAGCAGALDFVPHLELLTCPVAGQSITISLSQGYGGSTSVVFLGAAPASLPIGLTGCSLLTAPLLPITLAIPLSGSGPGAGTFAVTGPLPASSSGFAFSMQVFVPDPVVPRGFSASNGITIAVP